jgi:hypothetical protein
MRLRYTPRHSGIKVTRPAIGIKHASSDVCAARRWRISNKHIVASPKCCLIGALLAFSLPLAAPLSSRAAARSLRRAESPPRAFLCEAAEEGGQSALSSLCAVVVLLASGRQFSGLDAVGVIRPRPIRAERKRRGRGRCSRYCGGARAGRGDSLLYERGPPGGVCRRDAAKRGRDNVRRGSVRNRLSLDRDAAIVGSERATRLAALTEPVKKRVPEHAGS